MGEREREKVKVKKMLEREGELVCKVSELGNCWTRMVLVGK